MYQWPETGSNLREHKVVGPETSTL
uniref:Uncharacterized protein n=1 Tax=Anguilla anguilla TaxID=7936 RepID=A0A0E9P6P4_ANGAN